MTIRDLIEKPIFELIEFYTKSCFDQGEGIEYLGVKLFDEPSKFVKGAFFNDCSHLCAYYKRTDDPRFDNAVERLHFAAKLIAGDHVGTWGKTSTLHGMCILKQNGLDNIITPDELAGIEEKTRYDDFLDKKTVTLKGAPTNYYQVAMACAGMREMLGFENDGYCEKLKDKLFSIMSGFSDTGWMDENPPYGRFDRYTMMICAELSDTLYYIGIDTPEFAKVNLRNACDLALACANPRGDGIIYGRSLSVHGDCGFLEIMSTAARLGMISDEQLPTAMAYSRAILEKTFDFWYDKDRHSFDLWFCGRTTNGYRQIARLMEVNLDMCNHMLTTLANFEAAGLADIDIPDTFPENPHKIGNPYKVQFSFENEKNRTLYTFVQDGKLIQLPLINPGNMSLCAAYQPFPASVKELEASPESSIPWLVPRFEIEGQKYLPIGFYSEITDSSTNAKTVITAKGFLMKYVSRTPEKSDIPFTAVYTFTKEKLSLEFILENELDYELIYGRPLRAKCSVNCNGTEELYDVSDDKAYFTPHGRCDIAKKWTGRSKHITVEITDLF